ncbi:conjugal transfer protein TraL, partial [Salmonella enterica]|nr:conjugal transfer protein TraL [Salmonella enterica]
MAKHKPFKQVHIILQGKGGCGKSLVGTILAQYFKLHKGQNIEAFDLDQVNTTLSQYKNLDVKHIRITEKDNINEINQRLLDGFIQAIIESDAETIIVDTGSN